MTVTEMTEEDSPGGLFRRARLGMLGARTVLAPCSLNMYHLYIRLSNLKHGQDSCSLGLSFDDHCLSHSVIVKLHVPVLTQACGLLRESVGGVGFEVVSCGLCVCLVCVPAPPVDLNQFCQGRATRHFPCGHWPAAHGWGARVPRRFSVSLSQRSGGGSHPRCLRRLASAKVRRRCRQA